MARRIVAPLTAAALTGLAACPARPLASAREARAEGRLEAAGDAYLAAARRDPALLGAWDGAVDVWCRERVHIARCLGVLDLELELLGTVARHRDALSVALESRARARIEAGLAEAALADLERAAKAAPERGRVHVAKARALIMLGRREAALEALATARRLEPGLPEADEVADLVPAPPARVDDDEPGFGGVRPGTEPAPPPAESSDPAPR
jgi:tetratricopeptide (TPR) repeat protein